MCMLVPLKFSRKSKKMTKAQNTEAKKKHRCEHINGDTVINSLCRIQYNRHFTFIISTDESEKRTGEKVWEIKMATHTTYTYTYTLIAIHNTANRSHYKCA